LRRADNTTFETIDPAAQQTLAQVARVKADVERAVKAARAALITATGRRPPAQQSGAHSLCRPDGAHREELALLETLDTGKPIRHSLRDDIPGAARAIRWYAEALDKVYGEVAPPAATSWR
jgi:gamma-glutamyl-gamma-aminobutyraldehyde dehydrogenase